tara:strand:+ start:388 stop:1113 length:726 start_codon:yes stop_codon:yes gene_type:complete
MALSFDGSDDYLTHSGAIFSGSATDYSWTLVAWCRPDDQHEGFVIGADQGSGNLGRFGVFSRSNGRFALRRKSGYISTPDADYNDSNTAWFHLAGVFTYGGRALYVNGTSEVTQTSNISIDPSNATIFNIGRDHEGKYWDGGIAEAAAYSVALADKDITALATGFSPLLVRPDRLIGYWPLGGGHFPATVNPIGSTSLSVNSSPSAEAHPRIFYPTSPQIGVPSGTIVPNAMHHYRMLRCS